jgi:hypothetical protein
MLERQISLSAYSRIAFLICRSRQINVKRTLGFGCDFFASPELMKCRTGQSVPANVNLSRVKYPTSTEVEVADSRTSKPRASTARGFLLSCAAFVLFLRRKNNSLVPDLIPRCGEHPCFDCLASPPYYAGHRSLMDSSLDVTIAKMQIGPDVEAAIGDTPCGRCNPWFPAQIADWERNGRAQARPLCFRG